ncbi:MAG: DNA repair exonuclease [Candidatus Nanoarchaeia archaeon]|nr:DNA repair exonuclease [Candidatus Nanoarchaeia archaeon]
MKFAHMADCHIGGWNDAKLRDANAKAFQKAVQTCIEKKVDFVLIAGDLFNTALPSIDSLKTAVKQLKKLKDNEIPVYTIPGSHDFSPSGKTIIDVLENAGLITNVMKGKQIDEKLNLEFTFDEKTKVKITGIYGRKGMLDKSQYGNLARKSIEDEDGFKIFMFHTALTEFKPKELESMDSQPISILPKNFDYYAGGHVHYIFTKKEEGYGTVVYPGPLFPNNFSEIENLENGGFYIVEKNQDELKLDYEPIIIYNVFSLKIDCDKKTPEQVKTTIQEKIEGREFINTIVTLRLFGTLDSGKCSDINLKSILEKIYEQGAHFVMKNTSALKTKEMDEIEVSSKSVEETEKILIEESIGKIKVENLDSENEKILIENLMNILSMEKEDGEKVADYQKRLKDQLNKVVDLG